MSLNAPAVKTSYRVLVGIVLCLMHFVGVVAWSHQASGSIWLGLSALPICMWMLYLLLRHPSELWLLTAWLLPLTTESGDAGWVRWLGMVPLAALGIRGCMVWIWWKLAQSGADRGVSTWLQDSNWQSRLLLMLCIWQLICAVFAVQQGPAWEAAFRFVAPVAGLMLGGFSDQGIVKRWLGQYALAMLVLLLYALLLSPHPGKASSIPFMTGDNALAGALLPILFLLPVISPNRYGRLAALLAAAAVFCWILFVSRGALLGALVGMLVFAALLGRNRIFRWVLLCTALAGIAFFMWPRQVVGTNENTRQVFAEKHRFSNAERQMRWELALRIAADHPVVGLGPGCYAPHFKRYLRDDSEVARIAYWPGWTGGAHQLALNALAETGIVGALLLLGWLMLGLLGLGKAALQDANRDGSDSNRIGLACLAGIVALIAHAMVEDLLVVDACLAVLLVSFHARPRP